jgi:hypothetical protein
LERAPKLYFYNNEKYKKGHMGVQNICVLGVF